MGWDGARSERLYGIHAWGAGYFGVSDKGTVVVRPGRDDERWADLHEIVQGLRERGIKPPLLIRFEQILRDRIAALRDAFASAMRENGYRGGHLCAFPIKVNQQRHVVLTVLQALPPDEAGLEVGSKPEAVAALGITAGLPGVVVICNGFKDRRYVETALLASKLGRRVILVVEKLTELKLVLELAASMGAKPELGLRVKISSKGVGRWSDSVGMRAKFGLHVPEVLEALKMLKNAGMLDGLQLVHCHIGSQVPEMWSIKEAVTELARIYVELWRLGARPSMLDVGGGLGVDYDGSHSGSEASINYTMEEYASDVVYRVGSVCTEAGVPHPTLVTESGRALAAHHSVLVLDVLGRGLLRPGNGRRRKWELPPNPSSPLRDLMVAKELAEEGKLEEAYHDAIQAREEACNLFRLGYISLQERAMAEDLYWSVMERLRAEAVKPSAPVQLKPLTEELEAIYFCNWSIFQSLPDAWAISQLFPVLPLNKLDREPTVRAILADMTCDSEGKLDRFIGSPTPRRTLLLHELEDGEQYELGVFLVGAYQEILGDYHNLFGDTHAVHVEVTGPGKWRLKRLVEGETVAQVLRYVQYDPERLKTAVRSEAEAAVDKGALGVREARALVENYQAALSGYTYLEDDVGLP